MSDQPGLFPALTPTIRFCGASMGGYGEWTGISKSEAALSLIVPVEIVSGHSINDFNSPTYRREIARLLTEGLGE